MQRVFVTICLLWLATLGCALIGAQPALPSEQLDPELTP